MSRTGWSHVVFLFGARLRSGLVAVCALLIACGSEAPSASPASPASSPPAREAIPEESDAAGLPGLHGLVSEDARHTRRVWAWRDDGFSTQLVASESVGGTFPAPRTLVGPEGNPDRPAISPDGQAVAFVWGRSGLASVWVIPFHAAPPPSGKDGSTGEARQLTNVGLVAGGGRPDGFVPPPIDALHFDGDWLRWRSAEGEHQVRWR